MLFNGFNLKQCYCFIVFWIFAVNSTQAGEPAILTSPNGTVSLTVSLQEKLDDMATGERFYYALKYNGKDILLDSGFQLEFKDQPSIVNG